MLAVAGAACSSNQSSSTKTATATTGDHQAAGAPMATATLKAANDDVRKEMAETLQGWYEALLTGNVLKAMTYFDCPPDQQSALLGSLTLAKGLGFVGTGKVEVRVDAAKLIVDRVDADHVKVPSDANGPAVQVTVDGRPVPNNGASNKPATEFHRKNGVWVTSDCNTN